MPNTTSNKLPQHLTQREFLAAATATKLINHGRDWEVFLHGQSLGFADGERTQALIQAHQAAVNNALYFNEDPANLMSFVPKEKAELPTQLVVIDYPGLVRKFPIAAAKISPTVA